jgi:hypothetical protein
LQFENKASITCTLILDSTTSISEKPRAQNILYAHESLSLMPMQYNKRRIFLGCNGYYSTELCLW